MTPNGALELARIVRIYLPQDQALQLIRDWKRSRPAEADPKLMTAIVEVERALINDLSTRP